MMLSCRRTSGPARRSTKGQWTAEEVIEYSFMFSGSCLLLVFR
jgi:hypothetical protein